MATISIQDNKDSSLLTYTLTDSKGVFKIGGLPNDKALRVLISYTGYRTFIKVLEPGFNGDLGQVNLPVAATELGTVVIEGNIPPVSIRKDTIEFNASAFKTRTNAVVQDLLKKLPGVEVDENGQITVNGKKVSRVLVDGKEFFGGNSTVATENLPSAIVDKVQVVDTKTKAEERGNIPAQNRDDKTINITLKPDKRKGLFGRLSAGVGTDDRFDLNGSLNAFEGERQVSIIGSSNNLNRGSSMMGRMSMSSRGMMSMDGGGGMAMMGMGGMGMDFGGMGGMMPAEGIRTSTMAGVTYNDELTKKIKLNSSYMFDNTNNRINVQSSRERLLATNKLYTDRSNTGFDRNANHQADAGFDFTLDSTTMLSIRPTFGYSRQTGNTIGTETTLDSLKHLLNTSDQNNTTFSTNYNIGNSLNLMKSLKDGTMLSLMYMAQVSKQDGDNRTIALNQFYENGVVDSSGEINQRTFTDNVNATHNVMAHVVKPLTSALMLMGSYSMTYTLSRSSREAYQLDPSSNKHSILDSTYTNKFRTSNVMHVPQLSLNYNTLKIQASLGGSVSIAHLDNYSYTENTTLTQKQVNYSPVARIGYTIKNNMNVGLSYDGRMQTPTVDQLQPVLDNTNTLNIRIGNPDLKPSFSHNIGLNLAKFNMTGVGFFSMISFSPIMNQISTSSTVDEKGRQTTQYINVDGNYMVMGHGTFSWGKKTKDYQYRLNAGFSLSGNNTVSFVNSVKNTSMNWTYSPSLSLYGSYKELFDANISYRPGFTTAKYIPATTNLGNYTAHRINGSAILYWPLAFSWENQINYNYNSRISPGFRKSVTLWNMSLGYDFMKDKRAQIKVSAYDLLRQNTSVRRLVQSDYIEDIQTDIVEQYFMVTLTYNINKFGTMVPWMRRGPVSRAPMF